MSVTSMMSWTLPRWTRGGCACGELTCACGVCCEATTSFALRSGERWPASGLAHWRSLVACLNRQVTRSSHPLCSTGEYTGRAQDGLRLVT